MKAYNKIKIAMELWTLKITIFVIGIIFQQLLQYILYIILFIKMRKVTYRSNNTQK